MFGMGTGVTLSVRSPETCAGTEFILSPAFLEAVDNSILMGNLERWGQLTVPACDDFFNDQASRPISTGQLNVLLRLHILPINVVVFHGSLGSCDREI